MKRKDSSISHFYISTVNSTTANVCISTKELLHTCMWQVSQNALAGAVCATAMSNSVIMTPYVAVTVITNTKIL